MSDPTVQPDPAPAALSDDAPAARQRPVLVTRRRAIGLRSPVDASMSLLNEVLRRPLDAGYAEAAAGRQSGRPQRYSPLRGALVLILAAVLGLAMIWGVRLLRQPGPEQTVRMSLETEVLDRQDEFSNLESDVAALNAEIETLQQAVLAQGDPVAVRRAVQLSVMAGAIAVQGPGIAIEIGEDSSAVNAGDQEARITDDDLQVVVNGLRVAGAEAIAINGVRLTSTAPIRHAGQAIYVDLNPVVSPYLIEAIGQPTKLQDGLTGTVAGNRLSLLHNQYGASISIKAADLIVVPASGSALGLYYASVLDPGGVEPDAPSGGTQ